MARQVHQAKASEWRERLRRFEVSNLPVAQFCARERVTESTFWYWRRKVADIGAPPEPSASVFAPVDIIGGRSVTLRFPTGAVLEIPEDRPDLMRVAIETLTGVRSHTEHRPTIDDLPPHRLRRHAKELWWALRHRPRHVSC